MKSVENLKQHLKKKRNPKIETLILNLRFKRKLGVRHIQHELERLHQIHLVLETIHKVLKEYNVTPLKRRKKTSLKLTYRKDIPGERVQLDTMKIKDGVF